MTQRVNFIVEMLKDDFTDNAGFFGPEAEPLFKKAIELKEQGVPIDDIKAGLNRVESGEYGFRRS